MIDLGRSLRSVAVALETGGLRFALVGGIAVSARTQPRLTWDCDFAVAVEDDDETEEAVRRLQDRGYLVARIVEQDATKRMATVRLTEGSPGGAITDLLFASCGIEPEIVDAAEPVEVLPGLVLPVAGVGHLIAMKLLARDDRNRPADYDDLRSLASVATEDDWGMAAEAVELIAARGYAGGRNLAAALAELRQGWAEW